MRLFNLTDQPLPRKEVAEPQELRKAGVILEPGGHCDVSDKFQLSAISAWIGSGKVAVNQKPEWYVKAKEDERNAKLPVVPRKPDEPTPTIEPEKTKLEIPKIKLGSEAEEKPKKKSKKEKKEREK